MMKFLFVFVATLGLTCGASLHVPQDRNLQNDLDDFLALLPQDKILAISLDYLTNDKQVQEAVAYLLSDEFKGLFSTVSSEAEVKDLLNFLEASGLNAFELLNRINDLLGLPHVTPRRAIELGGIQGLIDAIKAVLPIDKIAALYLEKLTSSPEFRALVQKLSSQEFRDFVSRVRALPEAQILEKKLRDYGVNVDAIVDLLNTLFGWSRATPRDLQNDLDDFLALLPQDKILAISLHYLTNDKQVQEAVAYLISDEFKGLFSSVSSEAEVKDLLNFLEASGLNAFELLNRINDLLGLPHVTPRTAIEKRGIQGLIDAIKAVLPIDKIAALYLEKLTSSPEFRALVQKLSSQEFRDFVSRVRALPEAQILEKKLRDYGVNVDAIVDLLNTLFGWSRATPRDLQNDLDDFLALLPQDKILAISLHYLTNDKQVQEAVAYLLSDEFKGLFSSVSSEAEVKDLLNFLEASGLDAFELLNRINDLLGLPHVTPRRAIELGGIQGLIDAIKAVLPIDKIAALYLEKLTSSPDFRALVQKLSSQEFKTFVGRVRALPEAQRLEQRLRNYGVNVDAVFKLLAQLFGWPAQH